MGRGVVLIGDEAVCTRCPLVKHGAAGNANEVAHRYLPTKDDVGTMITGQENQTKVRDL